MRHILRQYERNTTASDTTTVALSGEVSLDVFEIVKEACEQTEKNIAFCLREHGHEDAARLVESLEYLRKPDSHDHFDLPYPPDEFL